MVKITSPARFEDAVHVINGVSAAGSAHRCRGKDFIVLRDPLCIGPCDVNPTRHLQQRKAYYLSYLKDYAGPNPKSYKNYVTFEAENLLSSMDFVKTLSEFKKPAVLWTSPNLSDRLMFWWVLSALENSSHNRTNLWVGQPQLPYDAPNDSLGAYPTEAFEAAFANLTPLTQRVIHAGAVLWREFASASPLAFDAARRRASPFFPDLHRISREYGLVFPQLIGGRLRLSEFDQAILDVVQADQWLRPTDLFLKNSALVELFIVFGDLFFTHRLREWAAHSPKPGLLARREPKPVNDFNALSYQLTAHGERLRKQGLESPTDAPEMFMGGCRLYAENPTWVRRNRGRKWWLEKLQL